MEQIEQSALAIASPMIINGEAVLYVTVFGNALRLAFDDPAAATSAYAALSKAFGTIVGAKATWLPEQTLCSTQSRSS